MKTPFLVVLTILCGSAALSQDSKLPAGPLDISTLVPIGQDVNFGMIHMSQSDEFTATGPSLGLGAAARIGTISSAPVYLEWSSTLAQGTDSDSHTRDRGEGPFVLAAGSSPVGMIELATSVDAVGALSNATAQITDSTGDSVTIISSAFSPSSPGNAVSQFALSQTMSGGVFTALSTNGEAGLAAAYGTIFDDTGFLLIGTGEDTGTTIRSASSEKVSYVSHTLFISAAFPLDDQWTLAPRFGPLYRSFDRTSTASTIVDIGEGFDLAPPIPDINQSEKISLDSTYVGAILGATASRRIRDGWQLNIGAEAGAAAFEADVSSRETVRIADTNITIPGSRLAMDGTSRIGRLSAGVAHVRPGGAIVSLNAFVDYMSDVPFVSTETVSEPTLTDDGTTIGFDGTGETYRTHSIGQKDLLVSGISLSVVVLF